ncbi:uncharacterized protein LOC129222385 [Uloborus diversus]|uniref:uncharacterized protein LOC129222385 n=1 Tax=Uloborus diversus TaxID=327109 RepID=UPI00240A3132|nr:uncharacterized protein LOC129222385 [Uloborus diversus]
MVLVTGPAFAKLFRTLLPKSSTKTQIRYIYAVCKEEPSKILNDELLMNKLTYERAIEEKEIEIQTCGSLFQRWRKEKKYWTVPKGDINFKVKYIDTGYQNCDPKVSPLVLALHGSPGSYNDFNSITSHLYDLGVRVVSPLFPDGKSLNAKVFRHTPEEKSEYVKDFLSALNIPKIDLLICHSSAVFPGQLLCLENNQITTNALCLLNPTSFENPRMMKPFSLMKFLIRLYEFPIGYQITKAAAKQLEKKTGLTKGTSGDNFFSAFTMVHSSIPQQRIHFEKLLKRNFPIMMVYSNNDKLIHPNDSLKMAKMMVHEEEIRRFDSAGKVTNVGGTNPFKKVLSFENGTHFVFKKQPEMTSKAVASFLFEHFDSHKQQCKHKSLSWEHIPHVPWQTEK